MGCSPVLCITQAPSHSALAGHNWAQLSPRIFASRIIRAEPCRLPLRICCMKPGTSMRAGHASMQGLSKQNRHLDASTTASLLAISGLIWLKLSFHCDEPLLDTGSGKNIILLESNIAAPAQRLLTADKRQAGGDREPQRSQQSLSSCRCPDLGLSGTSRLQSAGADACEGRLKRLGAESDRPANSRLEIWEAMRSGTTRERDTRNRRVR